MNPKAAPAARASAANALLDRGYGKPPQHITGEGGPVFIARLPEPCKTAHEWIASLGDQSPPIPSNGSAAQAEATWGKRHRMKPFAAEEERSGLGCAAQKLGSWLTLKWRSARTICHTSPAICHHSPGERDSDQKTLSPSEMKCVCGWGRPRMQGTQHRNLSYCLRSGAILTVGERT
jgi:hypothetical protein